MKILNSKQNIKKNIAKNILMAFLAFNKSKKKTVKNYTDVSDYTLVT